MEIKITPQNRPFPPAELEEMNQLARETEELVETFKCDLQALEDEATKYGVLDYCFLIESPFRKNAGPEKVVKTPTKSTDWMQSIGRVLSTSRGNIVTIKLIETGDRKGLVGLLWDCGTFMHHDPKASEVTMDLLYKKAGIPLERRAYYVQ